jgi:hypothetical protein
LVCLVFNRGDLVIAFADQSAVSVETPPGSWSVRRWEILFMTCLVMPRTDAADASVSRSWLSTIVGKQRKTVAATLRARAYSVGRGKAEVATVVAALDA